MSIKETRFLKAGHSFDSSWGMDCCTVLKLVLSSDDLQFVSEDAAYGFVLKWTQIHYPKLEDRREILVSRLDRLIRFPYMTCRKLKKVLI